MEAKLVLELLIKHVEKEVKKTKEIATSSRGETIDQELKQESKYDTRSIEAGYLAGAQQRRFEEMQRDLNILKSFKATPTASSQISVGASFTIKDLKTSEEKNFNAKFCHHVTQTTLHL